MSVKFIDDLTFDIYIINNYDIDFENKEELEIYLKEIFKRLHKFYNMTIEGFYDICVYIDDNYGVIIHLEKEQLDYYDYFKNQVDMRIIIEKRNFIYKVEDIIDKLREKTDIFILNDDIYLKIKKELTNEEKLILSEYSIPIYDY